MHAAWKYQFPKYAYTCLPLLSLTVGRGTATALHGGKGKETSLLSIKTQRRADTARFRNGGDLSSHACGSTEIGWTLSVWPPFWLEQILAPSLSMADEREALGEDKNRKCCSG